eukprot:c8565_g1_i1.p1 GENE.c8565_g1_i1~~c8565_g1_i1.p1  ORF type:complete len:423 (-),score=80.38 c8565_g1_i1:14-1282(-)
MGACVSALNAVVLCCQAGSCIASCCRCGKSSTRARAQYFVMFLVSAFISWILKDYGYKGLIHVGDMKNCDDDTCTGTGIVLRIALAMVLVSSFICLMVIGVDNSSNPRAFIQNDFFSVKWLLLAVTVVGSMFISNESAIQFGYVAAVGGGFFLLIGVMLVLEFAYGWNDSWVAKLDETGNKGWGYMVLGAAFLCYASSITIWVLLFVYFGGDGCTQTTTFVSVTIVLSVLITALSLPEKVQQGAILPCGVVVLYCSWLCASAVMSIPLDENSKCEARHSRLSDSSEQGMRAVGVVFTIFCVTYATIRAASSGQDLTGGKPRPDAALLDNEKGDKVEAKAEEDETDHVQYNYSFFQLIYALGAMYFAMVMINWNIEFDDKDHSYGRMSQWGNVWIKMATQWLTFVLYIWSLIAPLACPDRDFS